MARRLSRLTVDTLADLPDDVRSCLQWELDPVERLWQWLRAHRLSNRAFADYDDLLRGAAAAWDSLHEATIRSVCACSWAERALQA